MKTKCYCIGCKLHPLHNKRNDLSWITGFEAGIFLWKKEDLISGIDVECLQPESPAFDLFYNDKPGDYEWPITAYGDGNAMTAHVGEGFTIDAYCKNEDHED